MLSSLNNLIHCDSTQFNQIPVSNCGFIFICICGLILRFYFYVYLWFDPAGNKNKNGR
jgi:hypothetical protein